MLYPLADTPSKKETDLLGWEQLRGSGTLMAHPTGETRPPKKGEWYLSDSTPRAQKAYTHFRTSYQIAVLVVATPVTQQVASDEL